MLALNDNKSREQYKFQLLWWVADPIFISLHELFLNNQQMNHWGTLRKFHFSYCFTSGANMGPGLEHS